MREKFATEDEFTPLRQIYQSVFIVRRGFVQTFHANEEFVGFERENRKCSIRTAC